MFTKELIIHSVKRDIIKLQKIIESEERKKKVIPIKKVQLPVRKEPLIKKTTDLKVIPKKEIIPKKMPGPKPIIKPITQQVAKPSLFIPEPKLPTHLEYLKPTPTKTGIEIELGKLNPLIKDPAVRIIEANPDEKVTVTGTMGTKPTDIILSKEDINRVINKFSEISKIPVTEGVYKVVAGNLILSAVISDVIGSRFILKKMAYTVPRQQYQTMPTRQQIQMMPRKQQPPQIPRQQQQIIIPKKIPFGQSQ